MAEPLYALVARSLLISGSAVALAALWGLPLAYLLASRGSRFLAVVMESLVGVPTVLVGLLMYFLFYRRGPLGGLGLLYSPVGVALGEAVLVTPLLVAVSYRVLREALDRYGGLALALGADPAAAAWFAIRSSAPGLASAVVMSFSRAVGELGVALMVGGGIEGRTRTLSTAIALSVSMGEFEEALRAGAVLVAIMVAVGVLLRLLERLGEA